MLSHNHVSGWSTSKKLYIFQVDEEVSFYCENDGNNFSFITAQLSVDLNLYSLWKSIGKSVTDSGYAYVPQWFQFRTIEHQLQRK